MGSSNKMQKIICNLIQFLIKMTDELRQKYSEMIFYLDWFECI